ncbi:unnamed protein product, partial [Symbiodinium sp. KB8]
MTQLSPPEDNPGEQQPVPGMEKTDAGDINVTVESPQPPAGGETPHSVEEEFEGHYRMPGCSHWGISIGLWLSSVALALAITDLGIVLEITGGIT